MTTSRDRGMSIVELLVAVVLTSVIAGVLLQGMFVGLRNLDDANDRLAGSNDTQLIAGYFTSDVASADAISTVGTKSHAAPSVSPTVANTAMVSFWSLKRATALAVPDGMGQGWNAASAQFRIAMADEVTPAAGATGNRLATSTDGTSSITHSVSLAPAFLATISRRSVVSATTSPSGASSLSITKPSGVAQNDTLLAHVAVSGGSNTAVSSPGWSLVNSEYSGTAMKSLVFQKVATNSEPLSYTWTFANSPGGTPVVREAAVGIAAYTGVATTGGVNTSATNVNPCGGDTPVLLLSWTDRHSDTVDDVSIQVSYNTVTVGDETDLVRRRCETPNDTDYRGKPTSEQTIARNLSAGTAYASCVSSSPALAATSTTIGAAELCAYLPATVTMSLTEPPSKDESAGRTYLVRASTRTDREEA